MEINNFVNMDFLAGFAGTIVGVELIVYCTKELPIIRKIPTRIYTFVLTVIHLLIVKYVMGSLDFTLGNIYLLVINSLMISTMLCGGYDVALGNIQIPQLTNGQKKDINLNIQPGNNNKSNENTDKGNNTESLPNIIAEDEENASLSNRGRNSNINDKTT